MRVANSVREAIRSSAGLVHISAHLTIHEYSYNINIYFQEMEPISLGLQAASAPPFRILHSLQPYDTVDNTVMNQNDDGET